MRIIDKIALNGLRVAEMNAPNNEERSRLNHLKEIAAEISASTDQFTVIDCRDIDRSLDSDGSGGYREHARYWLRKDIVAAPVFKSIAFVSSCDTWIKMGCRRPTNVAVMAWWNEISDDERRVRDPRLTPVPGESKWVMQAAFVTDFDDPVMEGFAEIHIDRLGRLIPVHDLPDNSSQWVMGSFDRCVRCFANPLWRGPSGQLTCSHSLAVAFRAITLMNCRNVHVEKEEIQPSLDAKFRKRHGIDRSRYHILTVDPMSSPGHSNNRIRLTGAGSPAGLHICRGHFKDYRDRPLFGKHKGLFWWSPFARGSLEAGLIGKDYAIVGGSSSGPEHE